MTKEFPDAGRSFALVADDVRLEVGNKLTIIGTYMGGDIIFHNTTEQQKFGGQQKFGLPQLTFLFALRGGAGAFDGKARVKNPSGAVMHEVDIGRVELPRGGIATVYFKFVPFIVTEAGEYSAELILDDHSVSHEFRIKVEESAPVSESGTISLD